MVKQLRTQRLTRPERSDLYLAMYCGLGEGRSIAKLRTFCKMVGARVPAASTLEKYSTEFEWTNRAREFDGARAEASEGFTSEVFREALAMDERQMKTGQMLQTLGSERFEAVEGAVEIPLPVALRMLTEGSKMERLAGGKATVRVEMTLQSINQLILIVQSEFHTALGPLRELVPEGMIEEVVAAYSIQIDDKAAQLMQSIGIEAERVEV